MLQSEAGFCQLLPGEIGFSQLPACEAGFPQLPAGVDSVILNCFCLYHMGLHDIVLCMIYYTVTIPFDVIVCAFITSHALKPLVAD